MIFHKNCLMEDNSHEISYLFFSKTRKDVAKFVVCCSRDWRFKELNLQEIKTLFPCMVYACFCVNGHAAPYVAFHLGPCCLPKCLFTGIQNETGYILPIYQPKSC